MIEGRASLRPIARFLHGGYVVRAQLHARSWSLVLSRNVRQLYDTSRANAVLKTSWSWSLTLEGRFHITLTQ